MQIHAVVVEAAAAAVAAVAGSGWALGVGR